MFIVLALFPAFSNAGINLAGNVVSDGWKITWSPDSAIASRAGKSIVVYQSYHDSDETGESSGDFAMLSIVGTVISYEETYYAEGGAHPAVGTIWKSIDLSEPKNTAVGLRGFFPDKSLFDALMADKVVQNALKDPGDDNLEPQERNGKPVKVDNLDSLLENLDGGCAMRMGPDMLKGFAFHHIDGDRVAVRIGLSHGCEVDRGTFTQLGILLPIPPTLRAQLAVAKSQGTLLSAIRKRK